MKSKIEIKVIDKLKFATHGILNILLCDNQSQNSNECNEIAKKWLFKIVTSSSNYLRINGLVERAVQITKKILEKSNKKKLRYRSNSFRI